MLIVRRMYQPLSGYVSCLRPVDPVKLLRVHLQMLCTASGIANLWDRVSVCPCVCAVAFPACVSGLQVYLAYSLCCRYDVTYHFVPSGSDAV